MAKNNNTNITRIILFVGLVIGVIAIYVLLTIKTPNKPLAGQSSGNIDDNVQIGGDFELIDYDENSFSSAQLKGKLSLIYFGFTYCPDICPVSLHKLNEVLTTLDQYHIDLTPVFITIDPMRDTPYVLKNYLSNFHPKLLGLTGTPEQIKKVADVFKVYYAKSNIQNTDDSSYMMDHSSFIYLMDKNGRYLKHFYFTSTPEEIIEFIRINK